MKTKRTGSELVGAVIGTTGAWGANAVAVAGKGVKATPRVTTEVAVAVAGWLGSTVKATKNAYVAHRK